MPNTKNIFHGQFVSVLKECYSATNKVSFNYVFAQLSSDDQTGGGIWIDLSVL